MSKQKLTIGNRQARILTRVEKIPLLWFDLVVSDCWEPRSRNARSNRCRAIRGLYHRGMVNYFHRKDGRYVAITALGRKVLARYDQMFLDSLRNKKGR